MKGKPRNHLTITLAAGAGLLAAVLAATGLYAYLTDQNAIVAVGQANFTSNSANQGGAAAAYTQNSPAGTFRFGSSFFTADAGNHRVLIYNSIPAASNASADVVVGQATMNGSGANQGGATAAYTLNSPYAVCTDGSKLLVADSLNNRVLVYNSIPAANNAGANVAVGQADLTSSSANQGGSVRGYTLNNPHGVYVYGTYLLIADSGNHRVLIYTSIPTANNAVANVVVGQPNSVTADNSVTNANRTNNPYGVCVIPGPKLLIADTGNHRVLIYSNIPSTNNAAASTVVGQPDFISNSPNRGGTPSAFSVNAPRGVFGDTLRMFIGDTDNHRVLVYNTIPSGPATPAAAAIGQDDFTSNSANRGGGPTAFTLSGPRGLFSTGAQLQIADTDNHRTLLYDDPTATSTRSVTFTRTPTYTPTPSRTSTSTFTATPTSTRTPTYTVSPTITQTSTVTTTATPTGTPTASATLTALVIGDKEVLAYPAPARGNEVWFYYLADGPGKAQIEIYNVVGEKVAMLEVPVAAAGYQTTRWDISHLAPGVYVYKAKLQSARGVKKSNVYKLSVIK